MRVELNRNEVGALLEALDTGDEVPPVVGNLAAYFNAVEKLQKALKPKASNQTIPLEDRTLQDWLICVRMTVAVLEVGIEANRETHTPEFRLLGALKAALDEYDRKIPAHSP